MKVAIIGAGISGLSCALELQKHGISAAIFEKKGVVADYLVDTAAILNLFGRVPGNLMNFLHKRYDIDIKPVFPVREVVMTTNNKEALVKGKLGYIFSREKLENSIENQLLSRLNVPVILDKYMSVNNIRDEFEYIVVATGESSEAKRLKIWKHIFNAHIRCLKSLRELYLRSSSMGSEKLDYPPIGHCEESFFVYEYHLRLILYFRRWYLSL